MNKQTKMMRQEHDRSVWPTEGLGKASAVRRLPAKSSCFSYFKKCFSFSAALPWDTRGSLVASHALEQGCMKFVMSPFQQITWVTWLPEVWRALMCTKSRYEMFLHFIRTSTTNVGSPCPSFSRKPFLSSFSCWLRWMSRWLTGVSFLLRENLQRFRPWSVISWPFAEGCTRMYIHSYEECRSPSLRIGGRWMMDLPANQNTFIKYTIKLSFCPFALLQSVS